MKVALFGGTGFVGSYILAELLREGYNPRLLVRNESLSKVIEPCKVVNGDIENENAVVKTIDGADVVIYNIGIIREFPNKNITFKKLHYEGLTHCIDIAQRVGVKRFILMSANGVKSKGTGYQQTKLQGEEALIKSGLDWTIFRPSLIFGSPKLYNQPEFCIQLRDDMLSLPFPAPLFYEGILPFQAGTFSMSPIHVENIAEFFVRSITKEDSFKKIYHLGGSDIITWKKIIHYIASASGKLTWKMPAPVIVPKLIAQLLEHFEWFPVTRDQLTMLLEGNTVEKQYFSDFNIKPIKFEKKNLSYLM